MPQAYLSPKQLPMNNMGKCINMTWLNNYIATTKQTQQTVSLFHRMHCKCHCHIKPIDPSDKSHNAPVSFSTVPQFALYMVYIRVLGWCTGIVAFMVFAIWAYGLDHRNTGRPIRDINWIAFQYILQCVIYIYIQIFCWGQSQGFDMGGGILHCDQCPKCAWLVDLILSLPITSVRNEYTFSTMKLVKSKRRAHLAAGTLNVLLVVMAETPDITWFCTDAAIKDWMVSSVNPFNQMKPYGITSLAQYWLR